MTISSVISKLRELKATTAVIEFVVLAIEEAQAEAALPLRKIREADAARQSRHRGKESRDNNVIVTTPERDANATVTDESHSDPPSPPPPQTPPLPLPPVPPPDAPVREPAPALNPEYPDLVTVRQWADAVMAPEACADQWHAERTATLWLNRQGISYTTDHGALRALFGSYATRWKEMNARIAARDAGKPGPSRGDNSHGEKDKDTW